MVYESLNKLIDFCNSRIEQNQEFLKNGVQQLSDVHLEEKPFAVMCHRKTPNLSNIIEYSVTIEACNNLIKIIKMYETVSIDEERAIEEIRDHIIRWFTSDAPESPMDMIAHKTYKKIYKAALSHVLY